MVAFIVGLLVALLSLWGIVVWRSDFFLVCRGAIPALFFLGGLLAVVIGITTIRESLKSKQEQKPEESKEEKK